MTSRNDNVGKECVDFRMKITVSIGLPAGVQNGSGSMWRRFVHGLLSNNVGNLLENEGTMWFEVVIGAVALREDRN
jgi:hypothetical protein